MPASFVPVTRDSFAALASCDPGDAQDSRARHVACGTGLRGSELGHGPLQLEDAVSGALVFVKGHGGPHVTDARSFPSGIIGTGALLGRMSMAKISVGMASVAQALGMSTIPLIRPSTGAVPKIAYA
jgi:hypothetical protein